MLVVCALGGWNLWPFSSWELFSRLRTDRETGWEAVAVDSAGRTHEHPISAVPHGYRGFATVMADFSQRSTGSRDAICATWLRRATDQFGADAQLRVYRLDWLLSDRRGRRAAPPARRLDWVCDSKGAHEVG